MTFVWFCRTSAISRATDEEWVLWRWRTFRSLSLFQPEALFLEFLIENNIVFSSKENTETIFFDFQNLTKSNCIISIEKHFIAPIKLCSSGKQLQPNTIYCANVVLPVNGWDWNVVNNAAFRVTILKENHKVTIKAKVMGWQKRLLGIMLCFFLSLSVSLDVVVVMRRFCFSINLWIFLTTIVEKHWWQPQGVSVQGAEVLRLLCVIADWERNFYGMHDRSYRFYVCLCVGCTLFHCLRLNVITHCYCIYWLAAIP